MFCFNKSSRIYVRANSIGHQDNATCVNKLSSRKKKEERKDTLLFRLTNYSFQITDKFLFNV